MGSDGSWKTWYSATCVAIFFGVILGILLTPSEQKKQADRIKVIEAKVDAIHKAVVGEKP